MREFTKRLAAQTKPFSNWKVDEAYLPLPILPIFCLSSHQTRTQNRRRRGTRWTESGNHQEKDVPAFFQAEIDPPWPAIINRWISFVLKGYSCPRSLSSATFGLLS